MATARANTPKRVAIDATCTSANTCVAGRSLPAGPIHLVFHFGRAPKKPRAVRLGNGAAPLHYCGDARTRCVDLDGSHVRQVRSNNAIVLFLVDDPASGPGGFSPIFLTGDNTNPIPGDIASGLPPSTMTPLPSSGSALAIDDDSYADVVAVGDGNRMDCTGVLVAPSYVLTAGHCVPATRILIGDSVDTALREYAVEPGPPAPAGVDVALLHVVVPLPLTPHLRRRAGDTDPPNGTLRVIGFGDNDFAGDTGFGTKRTYDTEASTWGCDGDRPATIGCVPGRDLVLPADSGHDTCSGDSGGPVFEAETDTAAWRLIAITSRAATSEATATCGRGAIYVRVDAIGTWLDTILGGT